MDTYNTEAELKFLNNIGRWVDRQTLSRLELLKRYLRAMQLRASWGAINRHHVERHCLMLIERETVEAI